MKGLREKFRKHEGFTLVEMLIVVAIIAILVAVSIPLVSSSLEKARRAVDEANARDAISLATIEVMTENITAQTSWGYLVDSKDHTGTLVNETAGASATGGSNGVSKGLTSTALYVTFDPTAHSGLGGYSTSFDDVLYPATSP